MTNENGYCLNVTEVMKRIPHRFPMLLVDKVCDIKKGISAVGIKNVTINEDFFNGHFPNHPIMPGVMIIEAMAQTAGVLVVDTMDIVENNDKVVYFMSMDEVKFRKPVVPGDTLHMHVECIKNRGNIWKFKGVSKVDGETTTEAVFTAMVVDK